MNAISKNNQKKTNASMARYMLLFIVAALFVFFSIVLQNTFFSMDNIMIILRQASIYGAIILGVTWVFAANEMDVAFGDIAAFTGVLTAVLISQGIPADLAAIIAIVCGSMFGFAERLSCDEIQAAIADCYHSGIRGGKSDCPDYGQRLQCFGCAR